MTRTTITAAFAALIALGAGWASAVPFVNAYTDGESFNAIYAQGFSPFIQPSPDPGVDLFDPVRLDRFQFFKSGLDGGDGVVFSEATDLQLAIVDNYFVNLDTLTVDSPELIGLSSNVIGDTATIATGAPITFNFTDTELTFGLDYAALYVTDDGAGNLSPVLVPSLIADYVETEPDSGVFVPESDYGDPDLEYQYSVSNFINSDEFGSFLSTFNAPYADASFVASYNLEPLPGDYTNDGVVDAADYTLWRDNAGQTLTLPNETVTPGEVTPEDYAAWSSNYGAATAAPAVSIPEPAAGLMALLGCTTWRLRSARGAALSKEES